MYNNPVNRKVIQKLKENERKQIQHEKLEDFYPDMVEISATPGAKGNVKLGLGKKKKNMDYMPEEEMLTQEEVMQRLEGAGLPLGAIALALAPALIPIVWDVVKFGVSKLSPSEKKKEGGAKMSDEASIKEIMNRMVENARAGSDGVKLYKDNRMKKGGAYKLTPKDNLTATSFGGCLGAGKVGEQPKKKKDISDKMKKRNELIKKVMREKGYNLPDASRYIKENNLL